MDMKAELGKEIASRVRDGELIGVGTGSTVAAAIEAIGRRISNEQISVSCFTTSLESVRTCETAGIRVLDNCSGGDIAWGFDGADAADMQLRSIKGGGGALLMEKIIATRCRHFVLLIDEGKLTENIAQKFAVPVEVIPAAYRLVENALQTLGALDITVRRSAGLYGPVITANGNMLLDVRFASIPNTLEKAIKSITGVVESGLFLTQAAELLVATSTGIDTYGSTPGH